MRCECGLDFASGSPEIIRRERVRRWEHVGLAVFVAVVSAATSGLMILHGEFATARLGLIGCGAFASGFAIWTWFQLPRDQRSRSAVPKRGLAILTAAISIVVGVIAYGLHDYLATTFSDGHDCTEDKQCRSTHCFRPGRGAHGVCTTYCETDGDCPSTMMCADGREVRPGEELTGRGTPVRFCVRGDRSRTP